MTRLFLAALLLTGGVACSATPPVADSRVQAVNAVWMLRTPFGSGSAVVIHCAPSGEGYRIVALTAKHVLHLSEIKIFSMRLIQGRRVLGDGVILGMHPDHDVAVVEFYATEAVPVCRLAEDPPQLLDPLTAVGYAGGRGNRWASQGILCGPGRCTAPVAPGDSGGAILNAGGELVGIVSGVNRLRSGEHVQHHHFFEPVGRVRVWVVRHC